MSGPEMSLSISQMRRVYSVRVTGGPGRGYTVSCGEDYPRARALAARAVHGGRVAHIEVNLRLA